MCAEPDRPIYLRTRPPVSLCLAAVRAGRDPTQFRQMVIVIISTARSPPPRMTEASWRVTVSSDGRRAVDVEWDEVEELNPWRFAIANAVGEEIP